MQIRSNSSLEDDESLKRIYYVYNFCIQVFKHLPWFHWMIVEPFYKNNLRFESDKHISNIECPIMILHAEDDGVIPFFLAEKV